MDCSCDTCKQACKNRPGFFAYGEAEKAAKQLDMSLQDFFDEYLVADFWNSDENFNNDIFLLAPAVTHAETGKEAPGDPRGQCIFYEDGLCKTHDNKPKECREYDHTKNSDDAKKVRLNIVKGWENHQEQIEELLGHKPKAPYFNPFSLLDGFFN